MLRVLEVGGSDHDGVDILALVQFVIIAHSINQLSRQLADLGFAFAAAIPDIRDSDKLKLSSWVIENAGSRLVRKRSEKNANANAIIGSGNARIAGSGKKPRLRDLHNRLKKLPASLVFADITASRFDYNSPRFNCSPHSGMPSSASGEGIYAEEEAMHAPSVMNRFLMSWHWFQEFSTEVFDRARVCPLNGKPGGSLSMKGRTKPRPQRKHFGCGIDISLRMANSFS
jgi:hypothetical protein